MNVFNVYLYVSGPILTRIYPTRVGSVFSNPQHKKILFEYQLSFPNLQINNDDIQGINWTRSSQFNYEFRSLKNALHTLHSNQHPHIVTQQHVLSLARQILPSSSAELPKSILEITTSFHWWYFPSLVWDSYQQDCKPPESTYHIVRKQKGGSRRPVQQVFRRSVFIYENI